LDTAPTIGFNKEEFTFKNYDIRMFDLGGGRRIRDIWKEYLSEIYAVIYVVDTAAPERFSEVQQTLASLLSNEKVREKPLLV
jgi:ADP-ribosylation factor-like protein 13B